MVADLVVYDSSGRLKLVVEVKNKVGASPEWAAQLRRNMVTQGRMANSEYFLLALADRFYLWRGGFSPDEIRSPDFTLDSFHSCGGSQLMALAQRRPGGLGPENQSQLSFHQIPVEMGTAL